MVCFCCHLLAKAIVKSMRLWLSLQESICRPLLQKECQYLWMSQAVSQEVAPQVQNWLIRYLPPSQRIFAKGPCPCKAMLQKCTHQQASLRGLLIKCQLVLTGGVLSPLQCFTNPDTILSWNVRPVSGEIGSFFPSVIAFHPPLPTFRFIFEFAAARSTHWNEGRSTVCFSCRGVHRINREA